MKQVTPRCKAAESLSIILVSTSVTLKDKLDKTMLPHQLSLMHPVQLMLEHTRNHPGRPVFLLNDPMADQASITIKKGGNSE